MDPQNSLSNLFFTHLISKDDFGRHMHDFYEIVYITEGVATHEFGKKKDTLFVGDVVVIPPHVYHCWEREKDSVFTHRDLVISADLFEQICSFLSPNFLESVFNKFSYPKFKLSKSALQYFESVFSSFSFEHGRLGQNSPSHLATAKATIASLLSHLIKTNKVAKYPQWMEHLLERMNTLEGVKLGFSELLKSTAYNQIYLCRIFKKHLGKTPYEYFNDIRLNYAILYLITTSKTVTSICNELGFSSYTYFYKVFKQRFGLLPKQYREQHLSPPPRKK